MNHVSNPLEGIGHMVHALDFFNLPSPHIKPKHMLALYHKIKEEADNYDGVVITHGTDTLEETAYFLDTMKIPPIPIVLTGAMRSSNELGSDGVYNYLSALRVASDDKAADKGVLVVMNDEIHAAKYVTKTHTTNVCLLYTSTFHDCAIEGTRLPYLSFSNKPSIKFVVMLEVEPRVEVI